jgi:DNA-binding Lrp family transcriptional regulator
MNETEYLEKIDEIILDVLSHFGTISLLDLWYELGESHVLKGRIVTKDEVLRRLEFLAANGFVKSEGDEWVTLSKAFLL